MKYTPSIRLACFLLLFSLGGWVSIATAQTPPDEASPPAEETLTAEEIEAVKNPLDSELVQVNWIEELFEGGLTMVFLGILSVALLSLVIERFLTVRTNRFVPKKLFAEVTPLFASKQYDQIRALCDKYQSVSADIIRHCVDYRHLDFPLLQSTAADIGAREIEQQESRCNFLSVIAGVAPLLGLLGTMIGMIESFKLVEVFGDEGGASLLAGSISKALITTAVGLVLAIPAVLAYYWARHRVHNVGFAIENQTEKLLKNWFLDPMSAATSPNSMEQPREHAQTSAESL